MGVKNAPSILGCVVLFLLTCWIPYINVGTFIAISLLPTQLAKGEVINPLSIFDSKYRRYMGEFLLTWGLMFIAILCATWFLVIPAIVISISWSLAFYYLIECGKNPIQAIKASNDATYGSKWTMFFVMLLFVLAFYLVMIILMLLFHDTGAFFVILMLLLIVVASAVGTAISASIWKQLKDNVQ